jgi:hypothetical protein
MDTRTGRGATDARDAWLEVAGPGGLAPLTELVFGISVPRLIAVIFRTGTARASFRVPPMSEEWLRRHAADADKHVDQL